MAKWGEGDPRWIVEERPDARNVGNWHWTEKNATPWSKERLTQLFQDFKIENNQISCIVDAVDKVTGEATVNNRKGKLIFFYEWDILLKWTGRFNDNKSTAHKGKISVPNLSEENGLDDIEITITIDESNDESETIKQFMYNVGRDKIRKLLGVYIKELREEYSKNLILPKKGEEGSPLPAIAQERLDINESNAKAFKAALAASSVQTTSNIGYKLDVRSLTITEEFHCNANDLFNALTKPEMVTAFTRGPSKVEAQRGGEFVMYGGNVLGKFEELVPEKKIQQSWRLKSWPSGHYSNVTIEFEESGGSTVMTLNQTGIPASEFDAMKTNWHRYYWHSIKQTFGFGSSIGGSI